MIYLIRHRTARFLAYLIGAEALVVMAGWIFTIDWMTRLVPVGRQMQFITAFLFLLSAFGLYFMSRAIQDDDKSAQLGLPGISITILLLSVTLFVGRMLGTPTGIEDLFLDRSNPVLLSLVFSTTGWPSFPTLLNFSLVGVVGVVALFPGRLRDRSLSYVGGFIVLVGVVASAGYLFSQPMLYYEFTVATPPMSLTGALLSILLGFGLMQIHKPEMPQ
ncbi:MAG: hypothetical protein WCT45_00630 [Candidatus Paceibacterota bacterium]|jgi:hypothetical protein